MSHSQTSSWRCGLVCSSLLFKNVTNESVHVCLRVIFDIKSFFGGNGFSLQAPNTIQNWDACVLFRMPNTSKKQIFTFSDYSLRFLSVFLVTYCITELVVHWLSGSLVFWSCIFGLFIKVFLILVFSHLSYWSWYSSTGKELFCHPSQFHSSWAQ